MDSNLPATWLDDCALLGRAFVEFREALSSPQRSKACVENSAAQFAEIVQSRFHDDENGSSGVSIENPGRFPPHTQALLVEETEVLEQIQAMSSLARSGVETLGWWNAMQKRFDDLASRLSNHQSSAKGSSESELSGTNDLATE